MKVIVALALLFVFLLVVGVPYRYEKESFNVTKSPVTNEINIELVSTVSESLLGMPVTQSSPYKLTFFCFDKGCFPGEVLVTLIFDDSTDLFEKVSSTLTDGGLNVTSPPILFDRAFRDNEEFQIMVSFRGTMSGEERLKWDVQYTYSSGYSFLPLWVYFTH
jgi:hypothetical protein